MNGFRIAPVAGLIAIGGFSGSVQAAGVVMVDWLELASGGTNAAFSLTTDDGLPVASGALAILNGNGVAYPSFPKTRTFNSEFWVGHSGFLDSQTGDTQVSAFDIRVAPIEQSASYSLTIDVPAGQELIIAIGGLFRNSTAGTGSINTTATGGVVSFVTALGWDSGASQFDQELEWSALTGTLPLSGPNPQLTFTVPNGYPFDSGDSISIGIGMVVPEPSIFGVAALSAAFLLANRRREKAISSSLG